MINNLCHGFHLYFYCTELASLLENVPLSVVRNLIFQHDGAPPHYTRNIQQFLNDRFNCWPGREGTMALPVKSLSRHCTMYKNGRNSRLQWNPWHRFFLSKTRVLDWHLNLIFSKTKPSTQFRYFRFSSYFQP